MYPVVFDSMSRQTLNKQRRSRAESSSSPLQWHGLIDQIQTECLGCPADGGSLRDVFVNKAQMFAWHPSLEALAASMMPGGLTYLCWGAPPERRSEPRQRILARILRNAKQVLVNDRITQKEILEWTGREAVIAPFFIDTNYFAYASPSERQPFLFCNGSNDRDPAVLLALAKQGYEITWLVNDPELRAKYETASSNLTCVSRISFEAMRKYYQTCAAYILPSVRDFHCAGQTTGLEAISSGAPVIITKGRTSSIFESLPSVQVVGTSYDEWVSSVENCAPESNESCTRRSRQIISRRISPASIQKTYSNVFGWNNNSNDNPSTEENFRPQSNGS